MSMLGYEIAVLHSAVRDVHEYRVFPNRLAQLELHIDLDSTFKNSVGVYCVDKHAKWQRSALIMLFPRQNVNWFAYRGMPLNSNIRAYSNIRACP